SLSRRDARPRATAHPPVNRGLSRSSRAGKCSRSASVESRAFLDLLAVPRLLLGAEAGLLVDPGGEVVGAGLAPPFVGAAHEKTLRLTGKDPFGTFAIIRRVEAGRPGPYRILRPGPGSGRLRAHIMRP